MSQGPGFFLCLLSAFIPTPTLLRMARWRQQLPGPWLPLKVTTREGRTWCLRRAQEPLSKIPSAALHDSLSVWSGCSRWLLSYSLSIPCLTSTYFSHMTLSSPLTTPWTVAYQAAPRISQARILEWVVISFSRGSS